MTITLWMDKILSDESDGWFHDEQSISGLYSFGDRSRPKKYLFESFYCCTGCGRHNPHGFWTKYMTYDELLEVWFLHKELKEKFIKLIGKKDLTNDTPMG